MKKHITLLAAACLLAVSTSQAGTLWDTVGDFFAQNPTNSWDVSAYGLKNLSTDPPGIANGLGGGARVGYWLTPNIGAALDVSYCETSWTFASLGIAARGTFHIGALAGGGASVTLKKWPSWAAFAEYTTVLTEKEQRRVVFGLTKRF